MRVLVAMSGGVDSSVAAALLQRQGHDVVGVTMKLWGGESDTGCCSVADVDDARRVADRLGLDHHVFNFGEGFAAHVVEPYVESHRAGRTPNPCIECNRHLKFDRLLRRATALGFDTIATGHHARIAVRPDGSRRVSRAADRAKDQSYVLHMLDQATLARVRFPVGEMAKAEVRALAAELGLATAAKPDSQGVCFITRAHGRESFLDRRLGPTPARVVDRGGAEVGRVPAMELVTVGQRRGLGLAGGGPPRFVLAVDRPTATVTVGSSDDLRVDAQSVEAIGWAAAPAWGPVEVQCSAHGRPVAAELRRGGEDPGGGIVHWHRPERRVAPGQSVVFYDGDEVVGGGVAAPIG